MNIPNDGEPNHLPYIHNVEKSASIHNLSYESNSTNTSSTGGGTKNFRKKLLTKQLKTLTNQNEVKNVEPVLQSYADQEDRFYETNEMDNIQNDDNRYLKPAQFQNGNSKHRLNEQYI